MDTGKSTEMSNSDLIDKNECGSPDVIPIDVDIDELGWNDKNLMRDPYVGEEVSEYSPLKAMEQFLQGFVDRYPTPGPVLYMGSLDQALLHSLFHPTNPCPLVLFIYHNQSVATNVFCEQVLCTEKITDYLAENFVVWAWDRTNEINYQRLLKMLHTNLGEDVVERVTTSPIDIHPTLICLGFDKGRIEVVMFIEGSRSNDETFTLLMQARDAFDRRIEKPDPTNLSLTTVSNEGWSMSPSVLIPINKTSEFNRIASEFLGATNQSFSIDKIENPLWAFQYLNQKKCIDDQHRDNENERLLVFYCSPITAERILQYGFTDNLKSRPDRKYGHGFYFLSPSASTYRYVLSNPSARNQQTILVCRVLVGRTCLGNWMMETCPEGYDSTTDESDIYVVYSNRNILPKYRINF